MKKMIVSAFMLAAIAGSAYAQEVKTTTPAPAAETKQDDSKTKVDPATLPDAVKATLASDSYKDWKVSSAWLVKTATIYYTIELKKEDKTTALNIDKDGKVK